MTCPKCGSNEIHVTETGGFGWKRGCAAGCLFFPLVLLGFSKGKKIQKVCLDCGKKFK